MGLDELADEAANEAIPLIAEDIRTVRAQLGITPAQAAKRGATQQCPLSCSRGSAYPKKPAQYALDALGGRSFRPEVSPTFVFR